MSTMYSRSMVMYEQSRNALNKVADDDAYLDVACFEAQQALEFLMKAILIEYGTPYNRTHDIRYLFKLISEAGFNFEKEDSLELLSDTITNWEEGSRYGKGVRVSVQTVLRVHNIYLSMNEAFLKMQAQNNQTD